MLAWDLVRTFEARFPECSVLSPPKQLLDITSDASVGAFLLEHRPKWVLNAAAYTNVDGAETQRELAGAVNTFGPSVLAKHCSNAGAKLIHFSTDQVFDGTLKYPRREDEAVAPCNMYGASKAGGEAPVLATRDGLVLRVQWLYGQRKDRFSPLKSKELFTPFADQFGAPTWTKEVAVTVAHLVERDAAGLFHFSYDDYASWAQVFEFVKEQWDLRVLLQPEKTSDVSLPARRPLFSVLSNEKLKRFLGIESMGSWKAPLKEFLSLPL